MTLLFALSTWLTALAVSVALEQSLSGLARLYRLRREPMVSDRHTAAFYQRSLFTFASAEMRRLWLGLIAAATCGWLAWLQHPLWALAAAAALLGSLVWDLAVWECVAVSRWQVAWRRGWRRSVRRLPTAQVARVHVIERAPGRRPGWLARQQARVLGSCCLALELHNGRAVKLPRAGGWAGRRSVEQASAFLRQRQLETALERRDNAREQRRAERRARRLIPQASEIQFRREIVALRAACSRNERQRAMTRFHELPPPDRHQPVSDTLMLT
jgi:hypothetical protein